ncbi:MAG: MoaD/ThiS family protein [Pedobacter sp.]|nr:MoaD/ThiS family protein [Pedobacter sp.]
MEIIIKYFGQIAEETGTHQEVLEISNRDIEGVKSFLIDKYSLVYDDSIRIAINQKLDSNAMLEDGDDVAFLPPFAGG